MRIWVVLSPVLLVAAFAAGWYLNEHPSAPLGTQSLMLPPRPVLGLREILWAGDIPAGLDLVGAEGWAVLVAALENVPSTQTRKWYEAFEARFGAGAESHFAIAGTLIEDRMFEPAIERIYTADGLAGSRDGADDALTRLVDALLAADLGPEATDSLLEAVTLAFPEKARFQLMLGELRLAEGNIAGAEGGLAQMENHPRFGERALSLSAGAEPVPGAVPLERVGNQFYVQARIDGIADAKLMLDTGAAMSVLSAERLAMLGYDLESAPQRYFATAGGMVRAPVVELREFEVGGRRARSWWVGAIDMPLSEAATGLLGMDFLSLQPFVIDQERKVLVLGPVTR